MPNIGMVTVAFGGSAKTWGLFSASRTKLETSVNNEVCAPISADAQNLTFGSEQVSLPRRHNSNDEIEDECSANIDWLAYRFLVLPVKKDIPDALDGLPECPWHMYHRRTFSAS